MFADHLQEVVYLNPPPNPANPPGFFFSGGLSLGFSIGCFGLGLGIGLGIFLSGATFLSPSSSFRLSHHPLICLKLSLPYP